MARASGDAKRSMGKGDPVSTFIHIELGVLGFWTAVAVVVCMAIRFGWRRGRKAGDV